ncbi:WD40 repeat-like protein [Auriculariales sp. MPI-PUGE-AT-0066]|nr:WD40 repeat-like protein [Auriculariales sp. MPI-PUGE-AT-0066]
MATPRELPGLYYDPVKNKYFPLSSRPKQQPTLLPVTPADESHTLPSAPLSRINHSQKLCQRSQSGQYSHQLKAGHWSDIVARSALIDTALLPLQHNATATALGVIPDHAGTALVLGTLDGGLLASHPSLSANRRWGKTYHMESRISAIASSSSSWIATSFGSPCEIYFSAASIDGGTLRTVSVSINARHVQDVCAAYFDGRNVALGGRKSIVMVDAEAGLGATYLTGSDVLSLDCYEHELVAGARDGTVHIFDTRLHPKQHSPDVLQGRISKLSTSASQVKVVDYSVVVGSLAGHLEVFDLRFLRRKINDPEDCMPLLTLRGHVSSFSMNLPIAVTPDKSFVLAAGQDRRLRMWSLRNGATVPLGDHLYEKAIVGLHVDESNNIWVCTEDRLHVLR